MGGQITKGRKERARDGVEGVGVRRTVHQYLQEWGPELVGGQTKKQSLSPHRACQPTPNDAPAQTKRKQKAGFTTEWALLTRCTTRIFVGFRLWEYPSISSVCKACVLPRPLRCGRWWSPASHVGNTWGLLPRSRPWTKWPPAWSCSGCCSFSGLQGSEWCKKNLKEKKRFILPAAVGLKTTDVWNWLTMTSNLEYRATTLPRERHTDHKQIKYALMSTLVL